MTNPPDNSGELSNLIAKHITKKMGETLLVEESGYPNDAEERHYFATEGGEEYRQLLAGRIAKEVENYITSQLSAQVEASLRQAKCSHGHKVKL